MRLDDDGSVDVSFKMIESMRFNRAGDRISHIIATAIVSFLREKYGIIELPIPVGRPQPSANSDAGR